MKEALLLTLFTLLLHATSGDRFSTLKFGQTQNDYILYQPNMQPFETGFTTCAWIRKLRSDSGQPTWFSYAVSDQAYEIEITDMGARTRIFGEQAHLQSVYTVTPGTWFHNCVGWDTTSQTRTVYINGELVDSKATSAGRTLKLGGYLVLGNEQSGPGAGMDNYNVFNGEMFNLNMFSKKLSNEEIKEMARDMCSGVEETYGEVRVMKWENILLKTRTGTVTEIDSGCNSKDSLIYQLQVQLQQTKEKLNETLTELEQSREETSTCNSELESKSQQLNETLGELAQTKEDKETYRRDLENKSQQLNATETEKETTIKELDTVTQELNNTTTALNQTQVELQQVKDLLEKAKDCPLNTTISSYWDLLYSTEFFGAVITSHKLEVLTKSIEKLEYFEGTRITDGIIQFLKMFHDGEDQCLSLS